MKRTFVAGDVHSCGIELEKLLDKMSPTSDDRVVLCGDVFDRGLHADRVWQMIQKHRMTVMLGNHEIKMIAFLEGRYGELPPHYYTAMNILYNRAHVAPNTLLSYLKGLPLLEDFGDFIVTHAGVLLDNPTKEDISANVYGSLPPSQKMPIPTDDDGKKYWWDGYDGDKLIIYGHLVTNDELPRIRRNSKKQINSIGLDTAAVHGGPLTGFCPEEFKFYSYKSGRDWAKELKEIKASEPIILHPAYQGFVDVAREQVKASLPKKR